jgi:hypothetical protein
VSPLERHCQLLLRAYPAAYREVRGEEIIGTLLDATPPERSWPWPRDSRGLIVGGLRARAALNRQLTTAANLRVAVLAGIAAYIAYSASTFLSPYVGSGLLPGRPAVPFGWPLAAVILPFIPMGLVWIGCRRAVVLASALPAAAAICLAGPWHSFLVGPTVFRLVCLAMLVALAGRERPGWRWFRPVGVVAIAPLLPIVPPLTDVIWLIGAVNLGGLLLLALILLSVAWIMVDARPAVAMAVLLAAIQFPIQISVFAMGAGFQAAQWAVLIVVAVTAVAVWRLRRQSAGPARA